MAPDSRLLASFGLVNEWLRFAELKNGALMTLNGAAVVGMHQLINWNPAPNWVLWWVWWATVCAIASILVGLGSFYARLRTEGFELPQALHPPNTNAVFFGHLADMSRGEVLARLVEGYDAANPDRYLEDLAEQIIINARNARNKFNFFNVALLLTLCGAMTPVGWLLFHWRFCDAKL